MINLGTTNLLLGIIAAVAVLEGLVVAGLAVAGYAVYRRVMRLIAGLESRHVEPTMRRVNAILDDVKALTAVILAETERFDQAVRSTIERVDETADRVRTNMRAKTSRILGFARGVRTVIHEILNSLAA